MTCPWHAQLGAELARGLGAEVHAAQLQVLAGIHIGDSNATGELRGLQPDGPGHGLALNAHRG